MCPVVCAIRGVGQPAVGPYRYSLLFLAVPGLRGWRSERLPECDDAVSDRWL